MADHSNTASSLNNLANLYRAQVRYSKAEPLYAKALSTRRREFGTDPPDTADSRNTLAGLYLDQGRFVEAASLSKEAVEIMVRVLGVEHSKTKIVREN